jgi:hypothetical protein
MSFHDEEGSLTPITPVSLERIDVLHDLSTTLQRRRHADRTHPLAMSRPGQRRILRDLTIQALQEFTRARVALEWAMTQNNLGNALLMLGERESGTAKLK